MAVDASGYGLGKCLLHEYADGNIKAVEKETLAQFKLLIDHKPLLLQFTRQIDFKGGHFEISFVNMRNFGYADV